MATPQERISGELRTAMKAGEKERLSTLRMLLADLNNEEIRGGKPVDEPLFQSVVKRAIKQRKEAATEFRKGGRPELAAKEEREAETLAAFLPRQASEDEIRAAVAAIVAEKALVGPAAIGVVMKETLARFGGAADGGTVNRIAREILSAG
jgi:uncharacterized protein YqeY